jgi:thymidylate kinase
MGMHVRQFAGRFSASDLSCSENIRKELESGVTLIVDRYAFSGVAYTGAKGYDLERCKDPDRGLVAPDVVVSDPERKTRLSFTNMLCFCSFF